MCADLSESRLSVMKGSFSNIVATKNHKEILRNPEIDAVVVSTPTSTHYKLVKDALKAGKHVLCEKPTCTRPEQVRDLIQLAKEAQRVLMTGHVFLYNAGIQKLKEYLNKKMAGRIYYMNAVRTNLGPFRKDVNAAWDLAAHDISIFNYLLGSVPIEVSAVGGRYLQKDVEDVTFINMTYPKGIVVNVHVSWLDPRKVRQITIVGDKKMLRWDDLDNVGPVKIYDRRVVRDEYYKSFGEFNLLTKEGDIRIPNVKLHEPLKAQAAHFLECIERKKEPLTGGTESLNVVRVLYAAQRSLAKRGSPVKV